MLLLFLLSLFARLLGFLGLFGLLWIFWLFVFFMILPASTEKVHETDFVGRRRDSSLKKQKFHRCQSRRVGCDEELPYGIFF